jgi:hypothetical protein
LTEVSTTALDAVANMLPVALRGGPEFGWVDDSRQSGQDLLGVFAGDLAWLRNEVKLADSTMIDVWILFADKFDTPHGTSPRREKHCFVDIRSGVFADDAVGKLLDGRVNEESED